MNSSAREERNLLVGTTTGMACSTLGRSGRTPASMCCRLCTQESCPAVSFRALEDSSPESGSFHRSIGFGRDQYADDLCYENEEATPGNTLYV
mmetsp:Transcript_8811/g.24771  ORF Transcript_8811/g.24771 Transcript_8811/m.24771 type:complete len:93 (-) Transcript_8811:105-383(-)